MSRLHHISALLAVIALFAAAPALAAPITVNVRVEGENATLFEGPVATDVHQVDGGDGTGPHKCDGTNAGANPTPAPTQTGALDDAARSNGFSWMGKWEEFGIPEEFLVHQIAGEFDNPAYNFWNLVRNWAGLQTGGCQQQVQAGDDLLFAIMGSPSTPYGPFPLLQLTGTPERAAVGEQVGVQVLQHDGTGASATPANGATVGGSTTGADGRATLSFGDSGVKRLKAERVNSIRSNAQSVCVYVPGSGDCGTGRADGTTAPPEETPAPAAPPAPVAKDLLAPVVTIGSPRSTTYSRGPRLLQGAVQEDRGIQQVFLRLREVEGSGASATRCRWFSAKREVFSHRRVPCQKARFFRAGTDSRWSYLLPERLRSGRFVLDVKVIDRALNAGRQSVSFRVR